MCIDALAGRVLVRLLPRGNVIGRSPLGRLVERRPGLAAYACAPYQFSLISTRLGRTTRSSLRSVSGLRKAVAQQVS